MALSTLALKLSLALPPFTRFRFAHRSLAFGSLTVRSLSVRSHVHSLAFGSLSRPFARFRFAALFGSLAGRSLSRSLVRFRFATLLGSLAAGCSLPCSREALQDAQSGGRCREQHGDSVVTKCKQPGLKEEFVVLFGGGFVLLIVLLTLNHFMVAFQ